MATFYRYPREHWVHLRTVNVVESPLAALRLGTDAAKRYKRADHATAVIWKMLMVTDGRDLVERITLRATYLRDAGGAPIPCTQRRHPHCLQPNEDAGS